MIRQISIFAENKKGALHRVTKALSDSGINMNSLITNDSGEFGSIRMLVSNTEAAERRLQEAGYLCRVSSVVAVELDDRYGSLNVLLDHLDQANVNLDYLYVTYSSLTSRPLAIMRARDCMAVESLLRANGYTCLAD